MVSTDGSRLTKVDFPFEKETQINFNGGIIVPKKGLNEVGKFMDSAYDKMEDFKSPSSKGVNLLKSGIIQVGAMN